MNKTITVLVSLGAVLCWQAAFGQTDTKTQQQAQQEVEEQVKEVFSNEGIKKDPKNSNNVILNGRTYKHVSSKPYGSVYKDKKQSDGTVVKEKVKDYGKVDTYVNGKDTIQAAVHPNWRDGNSPNMVKMRGQVSSSESREHTPAKGVTSYRGDNGFMVDAYRWGDFNTYELRIKRDTSNPETRADVEGSTYQAAKNTNIRKTFGSNLHKDLPAAAKVDKHATNLGPEAYWTPQK